MLKDAGTAWRRLRIEWDSGHVRAVVSCYWCQACPTKGNSGFDSCSWAALCSGLTSKDSHPFSPWPRPAAAAAHSGKMELQPHFLVSFQHVPAFPQPPSFFFFALDLLVLIYGPYFLWAQELWCWVGSIPTRSFSGRALLSWGDTAVALCPCLHYVTQVSISICFYINSKPL